MNVMIVINNSTRLVLIESAVAATSLRLKTGLKQLTREKGDVDTYRIYMPFVYLQYMLSS